MKAELLFQKTAQSELPPVLFLYGSDAYLRREWKKLLKTQGYEITHRDLKKKGPGLEDEDLSCDTSLFGNQTLVWVETQAPFKRWSAESSRVWERMVARADGRSLVLVVQFSSFAEKRALQEHEVLWEVEPLRLGPWLQRMNQARASPLTAAQLRFLEGLDADLLTLDNAVELWALGGEDWAREALGWGGLTSPDVATAARSQANPAFEWVESLVAGDRPNALRALKVLVKNGEDPIRLIGLLSRSLKIYVTLEMGLPMGPEAPFLIEKVRRLVKKNPRSLPNRGRHLLEKVAEADIWLKSRPVDGEALLLRLSQTDFAVGSS